MNSSNNIEDADKDQSNPSKKRKIDSLQLAIQQGDLTKLKILVHEDVDLKNIGNISLSNGFTYQEIPALFAAIITDQPEMVKFLVNYFPHLLRENNEEQNKDQVIDAHELVGSACILFGDLDAYEYGVSCLVKAMTIRFSSEGTFIGKSIHPQSEIEKLLFRNQCEVQSLEELNSLLQKSAKHLKQQAFFIFRRILKKLGLDPNKCIVFGLMEFTTKQPRFVSSRVFISALFLIEICGTSSFLEKLVGNPDTFYNVLNLTLLKLKTALEDHAWTRLSLYEPDTILKFDNLIILLEFACAYQLNISNLWTNDETRASHAEEVTTLIIVILKVIVEAVKTKMQRRKLISILETYVNDYERENPAEKSILLALSMQMHMDHSDFKIVILMLEVGCTFQECRVESSVGLEIILHLYQHFCATIFSTEKKTLPTNKWETLKSCVSFITEFLQEDFTGLSFLSLKTFLEFSFELLLNMCDGYFPVNEMALSSSTWPFDEDLRFTSMDRVADLAILVLQLIQSIQRTNAQDTAMKKLAELFFTNYQDAKRERKPSLLMKLCVKPALEIDYNAIQFLVEAGADLNVFNSQQGSIIHVLMKKESSLKTYWRVTNAYIDYPVRAEVFTKVVKTILNASFHEDQVDASGETAFDCFKGTYLHYPNQDLRNILSNYFHRVSPLSCIAAKTVRKHIARLPAFAKLPDSLQWFVAHH